MRFRAVDVAGRRADSCTGPTSRSKACRSIPDRCNAGQLFVPIVADTRWARFHRRCARSVARPRISHRAPRGCGHRHRGRPTPCGVDGRLPPTNASTFGGTVIAITGSVGKTSTKDLAWAALAASKPTWANERSFNNEQGCRRRSSTRLHDTEVMVLEMGMRGVRRDRGAVSKSRLPTHRRRHERGRGARRSGRWHRGSRRRKVGTDRRVARRRDLRFSTPTIIAMRAMRCLSAAPVSVVRRSRESPTSASADVVLDDTGPAIFHRRHTVGSSRCALAISGRHMATQRGCRPGVRRRSWRRHRGRRRSARRTSASRRCVCRCERAPSGAIVLNDSYNANPTSMRAGDRHVGRIARDAPGCGARA